MFNYESPIKETIKELELQLKEQHEHKIAQAIQEIEIKVDKDELIKALSYDRGQYEKGYKDGIESVNKILKDLKEEIGCMMHLNQFGMQLIDKQIVEYVIDEKIKEVQNEQN